METIEKWYKVSLRIWGDTYDPEQISSLLGLQATFGGRKGEPMGHRPGRARHETHHWGMEYQSDDTVPFEDQIPQLLAMLETRRDALMKILASPAMTAELYLGFSSTNGQGGAFFPKELLKHIAELGLNLNLDLYPPPAEDE